MTARTGEFRVELTFPVTTLERHYRGFVDEDLERTAARYNTARGREDLALRLWAVAANAELARRKKEAGDE